MLPLKRKFRESQIVIITNFVVILSVDIKRVVCTCIIQVIQEKAKQPCMFDFEK